MSVDMVDAWTVLVAALSLPLARNWRRQGKLLATGKKVHAVSCLLKRTQNKFSFVFILAHSYRNGIGLAQIKEFLVELAKFAGIITKVACRGVFATTPPPYGHRARGLLESTHALCRTATVWWRASAWP